MIPTINHLPLRPRDPGVERRRCQTILWLLGIGLGSVLAAFIVGMLTAILEALAS